nr:sphingolipid delta(4)-desaturase DES1 [Danaus plexippus plexippus]
MGAKVSRTDFEWVHTEEPHATRRKIILEKYPEIKKLYGYDPMFKWVVTAMVLTQFAMLPVVQHLSWPYVIILAYCFGGVINHSLMLGKFQIYIYVCVFVCVCVSHWFIFFSYHQYQGDEVIDVDLPTLLEAKLFCTTGGKLLWVLLQPFFYSLRPLVVRPKPPTPLELVNLIIQLFFDAVVVKVFGFKVLGYLLIGSLLSMGMHPVAGHFISEHYMFRKGFETYSYYGPLNWITFNVGYHNEHHDFPAVPGSRLPEVKRIASEFYDDLPQHHSWSAVLYDFIMDPDIGPYARIKRKHYGLES